MSLFIICRKTRSFPLNRTLLRYIRQEQMCLNPGGCWTDVIACCFHVFSATTLEMHAVPDKSTCVIILIRILTIPNDNPFFLTWRDEHGRSRWSGLAQGWIAASSCLFFPPVFRQSSAFCPGIGQEIVFTNSLPFMGVQQAGVAKRTWGLSFQHFRSATMRLELAVVFWYPKGLLTVWTPALLTTLLKDNCFPASPKWGGCAFCCVSQMLEWVPMQFKPKWHTHAAGCWGNCRTLPFHAQCSLLILC